MSACRVGLRSFNRYTGSPKFMQTVGKLDSAISRVINSPELARAIEAISAWDRKWKEAAAASPWFDMNKLAALEQSMKRYVHPTMTLEMQNRFPHLDDATRRYAGLLRTSPERTG